MFMRWPTRVTPRSIRSSLRSDGRKASRCSARLRLSSQSATSPLLHSSTGLPAKGLPEEAAAACMRVSGDGEREEPPHEEDPRLGGVDRPNASVSVGEAEGGSEEQGVSEEAPESGGLPQQPQQPQWLLRIKPQKKAVSDPNLTSYVEADKEVYRLKANMS
ncbi:hypothetical protein CRUP_020265 [Coryphaenoides rupestris]|nr:hypothetical protein CRUP_020265 [Coryphaenoides rupestris]